MNTKKLAAKLADCLQTVQARLGYNILTYLCILSIVSCGGGTSGTGGGGEFKVAGILINSSNMPVPGVIVSVSNSSSSNIVKILSSGAPDLNQNASSDVTDSQGQFNLFMDNHPDTISLAFQGDAFDSTLEILNVPITATVIKLEVLLHEETNDIEEQSSHYEDDEGNEVSEPEEDD